MSSRGERQMANDLSRSFAICLSLSDKIRIQLLEVITSASNTQDWNDQRIYEINNKCAESSNADEDIGCFSTQFEEQAVAFKNLCQKLVADIRCIFASYSTNLLPEICNLISNGSLMDAIVLLTGLIDDHVPHHTDRPVLLQPKDLPVKLRPLHACIYKYSQRQCALNEVLLLSLEISDDDCGHIAYIRTCIMNNNIHMADFALCLRDGLPQRDHNKLLRCPSPNCTGHIINSGDENCGVFCIGEYCDSRGNYCVFDPHTTEADLRRIVDDCLQTGRAISECFGRYFRAFTGKGWALIPSNEPHYQKTNRF